MAHKGTYGGKTPTKKMKAKAMAAHAKKGTKKVMKKTTTYKRKRM